MRSYDRAVLITAIIFGSIVDLLFVGGAYFLCAYKDWSLWTIFWAVVFASLSNKGIFKVIGINDNEQD